MYGEEMQLVDFQAQIASLYFRVVLHVECNDASDQRREAFSVMSIIVVLFVNHLNY